MGRIIQFNLKRRTAPDNSRSNDALRFIRDAVAHPSQPSDDFIVERAKKLLRHG